MATVLATPGVYIEEKNAFTNSVVPVPTAIPCFIGFTEKATRDHKSLLNQIVKIASFDEYTRYFGGASKTMYTLTFDKDENTPIDLAVDNGTFQSQYFMYNAMRLYYNNGGGDCYIISVGTYNNEDGSANPKLETSSIESSIKLLEKEPEPTMVLVPDAHTMESEDDYYNVWKLIMPHCKSMINRFAILDIYKGNEQPDTEFSVIKSFREKIGTTNLDFGAVYYPWVQSTVVQPSEVSFSNLANLEALTAKLTTEVDELFPPKKEGEENARAKDIKDNIIAKLGAEGEDLGRQHSALMQISPTYKAVMNLLREQANVQPPSGAMAGIYKSVDSAVGTHQAPANVSLTSVVKPVVHLDDHQQEDLNVPISGKAVNAIRTFPGKGVIVWGARTLDGNSQDWRYISVRRTVSMIELSVKYAAEAFVFEPNNSSTWSNLKAMITNFLNNMWYAGALAGATPDSSFSVDVGLGATMTPVDILDGVMRVSVKIAVTRPAEFIVITFEQQMQTS